MRTLLAVWPSGKRLRFWRQKSWSVERRAYHAGIVRNVVLETPLSSIRPKRFEEVGGDFVVVDGASGTAVGALESEVPVLMNLVAGRGHARLGDSV